MVGEELTLGQERRNPSPEGESFFPSGERKGGLHVVN